MLLTAGVFLFNLLCGLVPCDPKYNIPETLPEPKDEFQLTRNLAKRNVDPIVTTPNGMLEGYLMRSMNGRNFFAFQGVPYAETTAGTNRWKPPVPKRPWRGVREAKKPGPDCVQVSLAKLLRVYGSEDCLHLNIYTPDLPVAIRNGTNYPVIVYIHGGSFIMGSGTENGPSYLLNEMNVLVTLNYRLGTMGFMSTGDMALPGNYGLKDQALALKWVHENIEYFGGDKNRVSIWGNSAGGVSVHLHLIANKTRDYFHNALSSSGTAFQHWAVQSKEKMRDLTNRVGKRVGCQNEDSYELVKCLEKVNTNALVGAQLSLFEWFPLPPVLFSPIVEPDHEDAFLTVSPEDAYETGIISKKPYVLGMTKDEGQTVILILLPMMRTFPLRVMWDQIAPHFLQYKELTDKPEEVTKKVQEFYFKGKSSRNASLSEFAEMASDRYLTFGIVKGLQAHVNSGAPTYFYRFSFSDGNHNLGNTIGYKSAEWGAGHSEDIYYLFNNSYVYDGQKQTDPDHQLSSIMVNLFSNFAASGEPSYRSEPGELLRIWDAVDNPSKIRALQFDKRVEMTPLPANEIKRLKFWNELHLPKTSLLNSLVEE